MMQNTVFIGLLVIVTLAFVGLLADFMQPILWAAILAVVFHPVQARLDAQMPAYRNIAALIGMLLICLTVIIPALFIASAVLNEAASLYLRIQSGELDPGLLFEWMNGAMPTVNEWLDRAGIGLDELRGKLSGAAVTISQWLGTIALSAGQNVVRFGAMFFLMLYLLFFFLRDGETLVETLVHALPLGDERERALMAKFAEVSRATMKGTVVIGMMQGALGGILFWAVGISGAVFWGVVMAVLSLLPVVGASLVWIPAALIMAANGEVGKAVMIVVFGALVIGLLDNLLRPLLVGRDTRMPDYLVLLSTLGGLSVFGVSGFVIGPVIAALCLTLWVMFSNEFTEHPIASTEAAD